FGLVFGGFVIFVRVLACFRRFLSAGRLEGVIVHVAVEPAFVAVKGRATRELGIIGFTPSAVLPNDFQVAEVESGQLGIGDVGLALLVDQDAARGGDFLGPTEV